MGKVALVTGANRGLGLEVSRRLAARGVLVFAGVRKPSEMPVLPGVEVLALDVTDDASAAAAATQVRASQGRLDILVNNAGILLDESMDIFEVDCGTLRRTLETNTVGPLRVVQAFRPLMGRGSRIINISSGGGQLSSPGTWAPAYCISKTALNGVTVQLAKALEDHGIAVNAACPGWVRTDMGGPGAPLSVEDGAAGILWLALDAPQELTGGFIQDRQRIPW